MVRLSTITTATGDKGQTSLGNGQRVAKHHPRVEAYGTIDELNALLGCALAGVLQEEAPPKMCEQLRLVQNDLFDLGGDLAVPGPDGERLRISEDYINRLESWQQEWNANLQPLESFVLPGGKRAAAELHMARTQCRRAERRVNELASLSKEEAAGEVNTHVLVYLNRLSDLLFVLARVLNQPEGEILWTPAAGRGSL